MVLQYHLRQLCLAVQSLIEVLDDLEMRTPDKDREEYWSEVFRLVTKLHKLFHDSIENTVIIERMRDNYKRGLGRTKRLRPAQKQQPTIDFRELKKTLQNIPGFEERADERQLVLPVGDN